MGAYQRRSATAAGVGPANRPAVSRQENHDVTADSSPDSSILPASAMSAVSHSILPGRDLSHGAPSGKNLAAATAFVTKRSADHEFTIVFFRRIVLTSDKITFSISPN